MTLTTKGSQGSVSPHDSDFGICINSNLPLTYCNKCKSKNSAEKAAYSFTRFICLENP